jgi:hypothetical protein
VESPQPVRIRSECAHFFRRYLSDEQRFALELRGVDVGDRLIITRLMQTVQEKYERVSASGRTLRPIAVRCDGHDSTDPKKADRWVLFLCFPYLSLQSPATLYDIHKQQFHVTKTLLQARFPLETIQDRDHEQIIRKTDHLTKVKILHVPLLWTLILSSGTVTNAVSQYSLKPLTLATGTLLFSSPESFEATIGDNLKFERLSTNPPDGRRAEIVIRAVDPDLSVFIFPLAECKTYFVSKKYRGPSMEY